MLQEFLHGHLPQCHAIRCISTGISLIGAYGVLLRTMDAIDKIITWIFKDGVNYLHVPHVRYKHNHDIYPTQFMCLITEIKYRNKQDIPYTQFIFNSYTLVWNREICRCVIVRPRSHMLIVRRKIVPFKTIKYYIFFLVHSAIFSYISQYLETTWHLVQNSYIY